jgi:hydroxyethylthiazole kinase-like uncharacterized protein yjeF
MLKEAMCYDGGMEKSIEGMKIVTASEMARVEKVSIESGASDEGYMLKAGEGIACFIEQFIQNEDLEKVVTLVVGKGNNGGDAFVAGTFLLHRGFQVEAYHPFEMEGCSPLCQKQGKEFISSGGTLQEAMHLKGVVVDGLFGTGFQGEVEGVSKEIIQRINDSNRPVISIDIPSGVNGNTGEAPFAIKADWTLYLGMAKLGFFTRDGYKFVGKLHPIDFGMERQFENMATVEGHLIHEAAIATLLPKMERDRHKYQAGYVIALAGSKGMPGAAMLSCLAALRTGAGIVRLFHPEGMEKELVNSPYELIKTSYQWGDDHQIQDEAKRAKGCLIGPGIGKEEEMHQFVQRVVSKLKVPMVIDADALYHIKTFPKGAVLTPHHKEACHLLGRDTIDFKACQAFADSEEVTLVVKGAPTWIFHPKVSPLVIAKGDPGMATAGTGDVLTGMIAALLAQGLEGRKAAALGVTMHAMSGEIAAQKRTSYDMIASDLINELPEVFQTLLSQLPQE